MGVTCVLVSLIMDINELLKVEASDIFVVYLNSCILQGFATLKYKIPNSECFSVLVVMKHSKNV